MIPLYHGDDVPDEGEPELVLPGDPDYDPALDDPLWARKVKIPRSNEG